ncbi:MAG: flagellar hook-basal body complex protein, partial [Planctomycetota bacterium]
MSALGEIALIRGLNYLSESQAAIAHNLANVTSYGFKRRISVAEPIGQAFNDVLAGRYPTTRYTEVYDLSKGTPDPTGNASHVAIQAEQFLKVQGADGRMFFSRDGQLQVNNNRELVTSGGHRILDRDNQPILFQGDGTEAGLSQAKISPAGEITIQQDGKEARIGRLAVFEVPDT